MSALLDVRDLRKTFGGGQTLFGAPRPEVRAVDGISFTLAIAGLLLAELVARRMHRLLGRT